MIALIDYGAGNIHSIEKALEYVGATVQVTNEAAIVAEAEAIVLPGVGSAGAAMAQITQHEHHAEGEGSGLRLFQGEVRRIPQGPKIPHMGWNSVTPLQKDLPIFASIPENTYFYFAHSYYVEPRNTQGVAAVTDYGSPYCSVIATEQVWGTQFHPEKSGKLGLQLLRNFVKWVQS